MMIRIAAVTIVTLLGFALTLVGCGPDAIAPLPSPLDDYEPNTTNILVSSLTVEEEAQKEQLAAIIGIDDAVAGRGQVRITNTRKVGESSLFNSTEKGGFVATVLALPGDELRLSYIDEDQRESESIVLSVRAVAAPKALEPSNVGGGAGSDPDKENSSESGTDTEPSPPATSATDLDGDGSEEAVINLTLIYTDGSARLVGGANFIGPNNVLVIANQANGSVFAATADEQGAIDQTFPAQLGDVVVLFSKNAINNSLTSPATSFVVTSGTTQVGR